MFDEFLRDRARDGRAFRPVRRGRRLRRVRRRQAARRRRPRRSSPRAESSCPRASGRPPRARDGQRARQPQERARARADRTRRASSVYEGSVRYVRAARDAGLRRAVVSSSANCRQVLEAAGHRRICSRCASTGSSPTREHLRGKPAPDTFLAAARALGVPSRGRRPSSRTRSPASRRAAPGASASSSASTGSARRTALREHGADVVVSDLAELLEDRMIAHPAFAVEPWSVRETHLDLDVLAQTESVFALANGHIGLRGEPRRGRAVRPAGHLSELVLRAPSAAVRRGRLRLPGVGPDDRQRHERQAHPPARRRRAARRPLRQAARPRARARPARRRAAPVASSGVRRPAQRSASPRPGWSPSCSGRRRRSCTRSSRSTAPLRLVVQSELVANEPAPDRAPIPAPPRRSKRRSQSEEFFNRDARVVLVALDARGASC